MKHPAEFTLLRKGRSGALRGRHALPVAALLLCFGGFAVAPALATTSVIGAIGGSSSVGTAGGAHYTIPLPAPGATAGLAPHISLVYSSSGRNGIVGIGWQLAGISILARCPPTIARDDSVEALDYSSTDRFCLDGEALLVTSGSYGADGSTYVGELDGTMIVTAHSSGGGGPAPTTGPQWFVVYGPHGDTYEYGKTADSEVAVTVGTKTAVRLWALDKVTDPAGNSIDFQYTQSNGNLRPSEIDYTNHDGTGAAHRILFQYESLPSGIDPINHNVGGAQIEVTHRLKKIHVQVLVSGSWSDVLTFKLSYGTAAATHRARLTSVTECGQGGSCFNPTNFTYQDGMLGVQGATDTGNTATNTAAYVHQMDVNGDGLEDLVYPASDSGGGGGGGGGGGCGTPPCREKGPIQQNITSGTWQVMLATGNGYAAPVDTGISDANYGAAQPLFFNRDNKEDLLVAGTDGYWHVLESTGSGFTDATTTVPDSGDTASAIAVDFNGDGLTDLIYMSASGLYLILNTGGQFASSSPIQLNTLADLGGFGIGGGGGGVSASFALGVDSVADFNGDGRSDLIIEAALYEECFHDGCTPTPEGTYWVPLVATGGTYQLQSDGTYSFSCPTSGTNQCRYKQYGGLLGNGYAPTGAFPLVVDVNGDGLSDIILPTGQDTQDTNGWTWHAYVATGAGFTNQDTGIAYDKTEWGTVRAIDWDGDGKQDVVIKRNGDFYWARANGATLEPLVDTGVAYPAAIKGSLRVLDVDGSGLQGVLWAAGSASSPGDWTYRAHAGSTPDLMTQATDGLGNSSTFTYASMVATSVYTPGSGATYPQADYAAPLQLVTAVTRDDGIGGTYTVGYHYTQARVNLVGRGFLGFEKVAATDSRNGITGTTTYHQDWPYIGEASEADVTLASGAFLRQEADTWITVSGTAPATMPVLGHQHKALYGISGNSAGQIIKTVDTDYSNFDVASGKPQTTSVTATNPASGDIFTATTSVGYDDSPSNHCLGLPNSVAVTRQETTVNGTESASRTTDYSNDLVNCRVNQVTVDPSGGNLELVKSYGYDSFGNVNQVTLTGGTLSGGTRETDYQYDPTGAYLTGTTVHTGTTSFTTTKSWDMGLGVSTGSVGPNGETTVVSLDSFGRLAGETLPTGLTVAVQRTWCNGDCGVANAVYEVTKTLSDAAGDPGGLETTVYDSFARPLRKTESRMGGQQAITDVVYDALGRRAQVSAPYFAGKPVYWTSYQYDAAGRPTTVTKHLAGNSQRVTVIAYDQGAPLNRSVTVGYGSTLARTTTYQYNVFGHKIAVTDATNNTTIYAYTPFGQIERITDPDDNVTSYSYNKRGFRTGVDDPDRGAQSWSYDAAGDVISHTDALGRTVTLAYDELGRMISRGMPDGRGGTDAATWSYDTAANGLGRLAAVNETKGDGATFGRSLSYTPAGEIVDVTTHIGPDSYTASRSYDGLGRLKSLVYPDVVLPDSLPVANAGPDQTVGVNQWATLDGSGSYDVDSGQTLTYHWSIVNGPVIIGQAAPTLTNADQAVARFESNTLGVYTLKLIVSDGIKSASDTMNVNVAPPAPANLAASTATSPDGNYSFTWNAVSSATSYELWETQETGTQTLIAPCLVYEGTVTSFAFTNHPNGTYDYIAKACANGACSGPSNGVAVTVTHSPGTTNACVPGGGTGAGGAGTSSPTPPPAVASSGSPFTVAYAYDVSGALAEVYNGADNSQIYWQASTQNAAGGVTQATLGNGLVTTRNYDPATGALDEILVGSSPGTDEIEGLAYSYDTLGEPIERENLNNGLQQQFAYDTLGRLTGATLYQDGVQTQTLGFTYDVLGNLTSRTGVGSYTYGGSGAGPHAVTSITGTLNASYQYDAAGEMTQGDGRTYTWTALGKPWRITSATANTAFRYGPAGAIYEETLTDYSGATTTIEIPGAAYRVMTAPGGTVTLENRILVGGRSVAILSATGGGTPLGLRYLHHDRLGSVVAVTDAVGSVLARSAYGVWGGRVDPATWQGTPPGQGTLAYTRKGYTGHEELREVGLIHMGGRVYDPGIGRFTSADPTLQFPYAPQDLNRYSYVMNAPLGYTDPTGYGLFDALGNLLGDLVGAVGDAAGAIFNAAGDIIGYLGQGVEHLAQEVKTYWKVIVVVAVAVFTAGVAAVALMAYFGAATMAALTTAEALAVSVVSGAVAGGVMGAGMTLAYGGSLGDALSNGLRGAAIGAFAGAATFGAGQVSVGWGFVGQTAAHGVAGGLTGIISGGSFKKGFELAVLAYGAFSAYRHFVHEDPRWGGGKHAVYEGKDTPQTQDNIQFGLQNRAAPIGPPYPGTEVTSPSGAWYEGGSISRFVNSYIGGGNALSALHDTWLDFLPGWTSIPLMLPAAGVTYLGLVDTPIGSALIGGDIVNRYGGP